MKQMPVIQLLLGLSMTAVLLGACSPSTASTGQPSYDDPFAYCAAVKTIDAPDERYSGSTAPDSVIQALIREKVLATEASPDFQKNLVWRCMDGKVYACHYGANLPCLEKADISKEPTSVVQEFCRTNPNVDNIPAVVTGRATVYEWKCQDGKPEVARQLFQVDSRGYLADFWYELKP